MSKNEKTPLTLSEAALIIGITRQTLWEWAKKGWIVPLPQASKTKGRPAQLFVAEEIILAAEERFLLSKEQGDSARQKLKDQGDKVDKGDKVGNN